MRWLKLAVVLVLLPLLGAPGIPRRRVATAAGSGQSFCATIDGLGDTSTLPQWTEYTGDWSAADATPDYITSGGTGGVDNQDNIGYTASSASGADQYLLVEVSDVSAAWWGIEFRRTNSASDYYVLYIDNGAGPGCRMYRANGTTEAEQVATCTLSAAVVDGDCISATVVGSGASTQLKVWNHGATCPALSLAAWGAADDTQTLLAATYVNSGNTLGLNQQGELITKFIQFCGGDTSEIP